MTSAANKAIPLLQEVLHNEPKNLAVRIQLGWEYALAGDRSNAEKTFRECAQVDPADPTAAMAVINYYVSVADWPKAIIELESLVKKKPDTHSRNLLAAVYYRGGRLADAEKLIAQFARRKQAGR